MLIKYADRETIINLDAIYTIYASYDSPEHDENVIKRYKRDYRWGDDHFYTSTIYGKVGGDYPEALFRVGYLHDSRGEETREKVNALVKKTYDTIVNAMIADERVVELPNKYCFYKLDRYDNTATLVSVMYG